MSDRSPPPSRADYPAFYPLQTRWADCDLYGHVNNVVHYALFDTAVNGWLIGQGLLDPVTSPVFGVVVDSGCRYFAEVRFPETLTAGLRIDKLGNSSVRYDIALFRGDTDEAVARGHFIHVYVDRTSRRPVSIETPLRQALTRLCRNT